METSGLGFPRGARGKLGHGSSFLVWRMGMEEKNRCRLFRQPEILSFGRELAIVTWTMGLRRAKEISDVARNLMPALRQRPQANNPEIVLSLNYQSPILGGQVNGFGNCHYLNRGSVRHQL